MYHTFRKTAAVALAVLCLSSAFAFTGCKDKPAPATTSEYVVPVPPVDQRVDSAAPGEVTEAKVSEAVNYQDKVSIELTAVRELDAMAGTNGRVLFCELTITNLSDKVLDVSYLTHFSLNADGKTLEVGRSALANSQANKYYFEKDRALIHTPLPAKQDATAEKSNAISGVVAVLAPAKWDNLKLVYTPYKYYSNDAVDIAITEESIQHITADAN